VKNPQPLPTVQENDFWNFCWWRRFLYWFNFNSL